MPQSENFPSLTLIFVCAWLLATGAPAQAQCTTEPLSGAPSLERVTCGDALTLDQEPSAVLRINDRADDAAPRIIEVEGGAILINVTPGNAPTQIRTPHAIATVRGTSYVVDATRTQTSVFVIEGAVSVSKLDDASEVTLRAGDGVDVTPDDDLRVQIWGADRAAALLARFGR